SASSLSAGMKRSDAEFMQYRCPVGCGPSGETWARGGSPGFERTPVRFMKSFESSRSVTLPGSSGFVKLGQPVPESYLSSELNSGSPDTTATEDAGGGVFPSLFPQGRSVPS